MRFIITENHEEVSNVMAQLMLKHMHSDEERVNISITTGKTPARGHQVLAEQTKGKAYFSNVHYYIFDELWYKDDPKGICRASLDCKYFDLVDAEESHIHNLGESSADIFDEDIQQVGGLDLITMGVGSNSHFCGNQSGTFDNWDTGAHHTGRHATPLVEELLLQLLKEDLHSDDTARIPDHYISMGPKTVMATKSIVFLMSGEQKVEAVKRVFFGPINEDFPVSIFQLHPDVMVVLDETIAGRIKELL